MKLPWEKKHACWGLTAFAVIASSIIFYMILNRWETVSGALALAAKSLQSITWGLVLAYILNPLVGITERKIIYPLLKRIMKKRKEKISGISRGISILIAWTIVFLFVMVLIELVVPELYSSIESLIISMPDYTNRLIAWANEFFKQNPRVLAVLREMVSGFTTNMAEIVQKVHELVPNINELVINISNSVAAIVGTLINLVVGIIVSVYVLKDKEKFIAQSKRMLYSMVPARRANRTISFVRLTHEKFGNFITGKIFDSMIIGVLCFVLLRIFRVPYSALVSVVIGITNIIPFFGPIIGAVPTSILILLASPVKGLTFIVIILALQQFDGSILGPKILGSSTGLSGFWVLFAILVGSGLFGFWGMICAVPMFAVIYTITSRECELSLSEKGINYSTEEFENIDHIDPKSGKPIFFDGNEK